MGYEWDTDTCPFCGSMIDPEKLIMLNPADKCIIKLTHVDSGPLQDLEVKWWFVKASIMRFLGYVSYRKARHMRLRINDLERDVEHWRKKYFHELSRQRDLLELSQKGGNHG